MRPRGRVQIVPAAGEGASRGMLVDVGARGLCLSAPRLRLRVGQPVALQIEIEDPLNPRGEPHCVLEGTGRVVWVRTERRRCHAGLRFDRPVAVRTPFQTSGL